MAALFLRVPLVWHIRERHRDSAAWRLKELLIKLSGSTVVFVSEAIRKGYPLLMQGSQVIRNYCTLRTASHSRGDPFRLGFVGRLQEDKGIYDFVQIVGLLRGTGRNLVGLILGDGDDVSKMKIKRLSNALGIENAIVKLGFQIHPESFYSQIDVLVHPSHADSAPRAIMEAMAVGTAVVASNVDGIPEMIDDGVTGYLFPVGGLESAVKQIASLYDDDSLRNRLAEAGSIKAKDIFDEEDHFQRLHNIYKATIEKKGWVRNSNYC